MFSGGLSGYVRVRAPCRQTSMEVPVGSKIKKIKIGPAVREFMESDRIRKYADGTKRSYRRTLAVLLDVTGSQLNACELRAVHYDKALKILAYRRSESSLNSDRAVLRRFEKHLHSRGYLSLNQKPTIDIDNAPESSPEPLQSRILSYGQALDCFRVADETHPRERIVLALGLYACMRESEILDLRWKYLRDHNGDLTFYREKLDSWHTIPLMAPLARELETWRRYMETNHGEIDPDWFVVCGRRAPGGTRAGEEVNPSWPVDPTTRVGRLDLVMQKIFAQVGVEDLRGKGVHTLRRTGACMVFDHTRDIRLVQRILGHKRQETTELYIQYRDGYDLLKERMADFDPLAPKVETASNVVAFTRKSDSARSEAPRWRAAR